MDAVRSLHPTDQTLGAYGLGKLDEKEADAVHNHLESCPDCQNRVASMTADSFLIRMRGARGPAGTSTIGRSQLDGMSLDGRPDIPPPTETLPPGLADHPDYEVKKELGRGGMGVVYLAHNRLMGRDEVLKVMGRRIMERPQVLERFTREIRAVAKLRHPNIVTAYSASRLGDGIVFAMEYVEGLDLSRMVKAKGPLPVAHACHFIHQAALGLQHAHEEGLVHRDIKPANLMLSRRGDKAVVKVLDFGLAKAVLEEKVDGALTHEGQALGTPDFIAPEQILDAPSADIRADIYSLGGTLFYLLTGRPPFQANSLYDIYQAHISREIDPLNLIRPEVPAELASLVSKMMAKDPKRRFQTPSEVAEALKPFFKKGNAAFKRVEPEVSRLDRSEIRPQMPRVRASATVADRSIAPARKMEDVIDQGARWESLLELRESENAPVLPRIQGPSRRPPWIWPAAAGFVFGSIALGIVIAITIKKKGDETKLVVAIEATPDPEPVVPTEDSKSTDTSPPRMPNTPSTAPMSADNPFVALFNGKDLKGWYTHPKQSGGWRVENGILIGSGSDVTHLYSERGDYRDFHLRVEARYREGSSGAVIFRSDVGPFLPANGPKVPKGLEATIHSDRLRGNTGGVHNGGRVKHEFVAGDTPTRIQPGEWFTMDMLATADSIAVLVDGHYSALGKDPHWGLVKGHVALQQLGGRGAIEFRSIAIREFDPEKTAPNEVSRLTGHRGRVITVAFSPDSKRILTGVNNGSVYYDAENKNYAWPTYDDNSVRLWDAYTGRNLSTFLGHDPRVAAAAFSPDGALGASCGGWSGVIPAQLVRVHDLKAERTVHVLKRPDDAEKGAPPTAVTFSNDGRRVLAAYALGVVQAWELETEKRLPPIRLKAEKAKSNVAPFPALRFTNDQTRLITNGADGEVVLWDLKTGDRIKSFLGHSGRVWHLACSADDRRILSGGSDNTVRLWDAKTGTQLQLIDCREDGLGCVAISADGRRALTGGHFGMIRLWDLENRKEICRFEGHTMGINAVAFSPDGKLAVSGSDDKTARVWKLP